MWRAATEQDLEWVDAFLRDHIQSSMFLLINLRDHGLGSDAPYGLNLWVLENQQGVFAISNSGSVLLQTPGVDRETWAAAARLIRGRKVSGLLGDAPQIRSFAAAAGLDDAPMMLDSDDLGFRLDLDQMQIEPRSGDRLVPLESIDRSRVESWRAQYNCKAIGMDDDKARDAAQREIEKYITHDSHRVLLVDGEPVAMTGFNANLDGVVQIGGVFTPPELRRRGHARHAVAMHLAEAREAGATLAVLFAANAAAATAYRAIGFKEAGKYALMLFREAQLVDPAPVEIGT